ncbi:MAG TPA: MFS transporter [Povalibacter sp.]|nr:MFS transporter [Povalibacter sp.]
MPTSKSLRWWMISLLTIGTILNYLTRGTLATAAPTLMQELHITESQYSWIIGFFQGGIMLQPVVGYILDSIGLKIGLALFASGWAVFTMAHGLGNSWQAFATLRGLLGFAEGTTHTAGMKVVADWFPANERGLASGIYNIGAAVGAAIAPPLVATAIYFYDWRAAFVIIGGLAFVWVALWWRFYDSPAKHRSLSQHERAYIEAGQEEHLTSGAGRPSVWHIVRQRNFWGIALPRFLADPTWGTLSFWIPLYLTRVHGFDLRQIAIFAWLPFLAADLGSMFGPVLVLWLQRRGVGLINARKGAFTIGAFMMVSMMFVGQVHNPYAALALICFGGFAHQTLSVTVITMSSDLFRRNEIGTVAGMAGTMANLGVLLFSLLMGALVATVGYNPFFFALGVLDLIGAVVLWTLVREPVNPAPVAPAVAAVR